MNGRSRNLWLLAAPVVALVLRVPFLIGRAGLFGFDPYVHLYLVKVWLRESSWPLIHGTTMAISHDYNAWPGCHILVAAVSSLGLDPLAVMVWLPLLILFLIVLTIALVLVRVTNLAFAIVGGVMFSLLDFMFFQTQWYIPELLGLLLIVAMLLNELTVRRHLLTLLLLVSILLTHHLSFLIALLFWLVFARCRPERAQLIMATILAVSTYLFWDLALRETGSFPDIQTQIGGVHPALVIVAIMGSLIALKWVLAIPLKRMLKVLEEATILEVVKGRLKGMGVISLVLGIVAAATLVLAVYLPSVARFDGIGVQPSKLLMLAGGFLFLSYAPLARDLLRILCAFGLVLALFILNPVLFEFLPLSIRFLEFLYIPGIVLLATGAFHFTVRHPERIMVILLALGLMCPVLFVDDTLRYTSDESQRFAYSSEDLDFAEMIGEHTEPEARIVTPFGMAGVVIGISERATSTHPIRAALDGDGYVDALPFLDELAGRSPLYLVQSSDPTMYIETENDLFSHTDLLDLEASLDLISDRLELVINEEDHELYRFH